MGVESSERKDRAALLRRYAIQYRSSIYSDKALNSVDSICEAASRRCMKGRTGDVR